MLLQPGEVGLRMHTFVSSSLGDKTVAGSDRSCISSARFWDTNHLIVQCIMYQFLC